MSQTRQILGNFLKGIYNGRQSSPKDALNLSRIYNNPELFINDKFDYRKISNKELILLQIYDYALQGKASKHNELFFVADELGLKNISRSELSGYLNEFKAKGFIDNLRNNIVYVPVFTSDDGYSPEFKMFLMNFIGKPLSEKRDVPDPTNEVTTNNPAKKQKTNSIVEQASMLFLNEPNPQINTAFHDTRQVIVTKLEKLKQNGVDVSDYLSPFIQWFCSLLSNNKLVFDLSYMIEFNKFINSIGVNNKLIGLSDVDNQNGMFIIVIDNYDLFCKFYFLLSEHSLKLQSDALLEEIKCITLQEGLDQQIFLSGMKVLNSENNRLLLERNPESKDLINKFLAKCFDYLNRNGTNQILINVTLNPIEIEQLDTVISFLPPKPDKFIRSTNINEFVSLFSLLNRLNVANMEDLGLGEFYVQGNQKSMLLMLTDAEKYKQFYDAILSLYLLHSVSQSIYEDDLTLFGKVKPITQQPNLHQAPPANNKDINQFI